MRCGIRDLMLATTLVAIYAAGFAHLARLGGQPVRFHEMLGGLVMVSTMGATVLWLGRRSYRRAGEPLVAWRSANWWAPHTMFLLMFAGYLGLCTWRGSTLGIIFPLMMAFQQFAFLFHQRIQLSREGLLLGLAFIPWDECKLVPVEGVAHFELSTTGRLFPPRWPIKKQRLAVPAEVHEAVLEALAEIRGDGPIP
ncbi:hypothetical protein MalM25_25440 [Planctomycetes bacterium MalM25]|nr:hypothetical protein MalM25_25440 [Planctomycetes bacterium MalM25]